MVVANLVRAGRKQPQRFPHGSFRLSPRSAAERSVAALQTRKRGRRGASPSDDAASPRRARHSGMPRSPTSRCPTRARHLRIIAGDPNRPLFRRAVLSPVPTAILARVNRLLFDTFAALVVRTVNHIRKLRPMTDPLPRPRRTPAARTRPEAYRVLARKYRPQTFAELIGQDAMVQTLGNAIKRDRLAHAFLMTGVRGVGKTSTARLIAKALNCIGPDGQGGPTIDPCGVCEPCRAIAEGRHIDVIEMDAASHTGVDDVREIIEAARYAAVSARYKIYIVDEVHMLSKNAFNALLKTLEEPPAHVKFLFATTEVNKVPVTVLSRCQRFDLRRIPAEQARRAFRRRLRRRRASRPSPRRWR